MVGIRQESFNIRTKTVNLDLMKKLFTVLFLTVAVLNVSLAQPRSEKINIAMDIAKGDKVTLNPYTASDAPSVVILQNLYDGLFSYDPQTAGPVYAIAGSHTVSKDGLVWTFTLREAYFSDHSRITSSTFATSWQFLRQGPLAGNLSFLESVETPDESTLVLHLKHPVRYLPSLLCQPCLAAVNPSDTTLFSGAYRLIKQSNGEFVLKANPYYWDGVYCEEIHILTGTDQDFSGRFNDGEIQWSMAPVQDASDFLVISPLYGTTFLYFSASDGLFAQSDVRKALAGLVPVDYIRQIQSAIMPSTSVVPQSGAGAVFPENPTQGLYEALAAHGIENLQEIPVLNIAVHRGDTTILSGELVQEIWSTALKSTVLLDIVPLTVYTANPAENPYDFCIITWIADYLDPEAFLSLFRSDSSYNLANYSNPQYDNLLVRAALSEDRNLLLLEAEQMLLDSGTVIPVSTAVSTNFVRNDIIDGWYPNLLDIHPFKNLGFRH